MKGIPKAPRRPLARAKIGPSGGPMPLKAAEPMAHMSRAVNFLRDYDTATDVASGDEASPFRVPSKLKDIS